jgi:hypothetical protein
LRVFRLAWEREASGFSAIKKMREDMQGKEEGKPTGWMEFHTRFFGLFYSSACIIWVLDTMGQGDSHAGVSIGLMSLEEPRTRSHKELCYPETIAHVCIEQKEEEQ